MLIRTCESPKGHLQTGSCPTISDKPRDFTFTVIYEKDPHIKEAGTRKCY